MTARRKPLALCAVALAVYLPPAAAIGAAPDPPASPSAGIDLAGVDSSVAPGDDFFRYANGTWLKTTEIPPDRAAYGSGAALAELTSKRTAELIQQAAASKAPAGSLAQKIGDYYTSYMDEAGIAAKGLAALQPALDRVAAIADRRALARALGGTLRADVDALNGTN